MVYSQTILQNKYKVSQGKGEREKEGTRREVHLKSALISPSLSD